MTKKHLNIPNAKRNASGAIKGYNYQFWNTIFTWINLKDDELLYIEGAEDYDISSKDNIKSVQVKSSVKNITLNSKSVISAINNYWALFSKNPQKVVLYKYLTPANIGQEKSKPFGKNRNGLDLWEKSTKTIEIAEEVRDYLIGNTRLSDELIQYLSTSNISTIQAELFCRLEWCTGSKSTNQIIQSIEKLLSSHGDKFNVPPATSKKVKNHLLAEVLKIAASKIHYPLSKLDFLEIFEKNCLIQVPIGLQDNKPALPFPFGVDKSNISTELVIGDTTKAVPDIFFNAHSRDTIVDACFDKLNITDVLNIHGSTGTGKSTVAKLIANKEPGNWYWINLKNIESKYISFYLKQELSNWYNKNSQKNIIIDNLNFSRNEINTISEDIELFLYTIFMLKRKVVITSTKEVPSLIQLKLEDLIIDNYRIPLFKKSEIADLCRKYDCRNSDIANNWSTLIFTQTLGHPQLLHARILELKKNEWPSILPKDIISQPKVIQKIRGEARKTLIGALSDAQKELLYSLSLLIEPFTRKQAISMGELSNFTKHVGDDFDDLIGPWVEPYYDEYFTVSPLLRDAASRAWSKEKIMRYHSLIPEAILLCGTISAPEIKEIIFHILITQETRYLFTIINKLLIADSKDWNVIVKRLGILTEISLNAPVFPNDSHINSLFRWLQFRIAVNIDIDKAQKFIDLLGEELKPYSPNDSYVIAKFYFSAMALVYPEAHLAPKTLIKLFSVFLEYKKPAIKIIKKNSPSDVNQISPLYSDESINVLIQTIAYSCNKPSFVEELFEEMENTDKKIRKKILNVLNDETVSEILIGRVFVKTSKQESPNWDYCLSVYDKALEYSKKWKAKILCHEIIRSIVIVYDEYLNNSKTALLKLNEYTSSFGNSKILENAKATILYNSKKFKDALEIWDSFLWKWSLPKEKHFTTPMYSMRLAGISAGKIKQHKLSAKYFLEAYQFAKDFDQIDFALGYKADAAYALWMDKQHVDSIQLYYETLSQLENLNDEQNYKRIFALKKLIGNTLTWFSKECSNDAQDNLLEPYPGLCSILEPPEELYSLPESRIDNIYIFLLEIEFWSNSNPLIFKILSQKFSNSEYPLVCFLFHSLRLLYAFKNYSFKQLPEIISRIEFCVAVLQELKSKGIEIDIVSSKFTDVKTNIDCPLMSILSSSIFHYSLLCCVCQNKSIDETLDSWTKNLKVLKINTHTFSQYIKLARTIFKSNIENVYQYLKSQSTSIDEKILSAVKIIEIGIKQPPYLFHAQYSLFQIMEKVSSTFKIKSSTDIVECFAQQWLEISKAPYNLVAPSISIPELVTACNREGFWKKRFASIMLAASFAVSSKFNAKQTEELQTIIDSDSNIL